MEYFEVMRKEVEQELERRSHSIAGSISRIRSDLRLPTEPIKDAVKKHPVEIIVGAVAVGLVVGWIAGAPKGRPKKVSRPTKKADSADLTSEFIHLVRAGRAAGLDEERAVARALALSSAPVKEPPNRPRLDLTQRLGDHIISLVDAVLRTALRVVAREAAVWVAGAVRRDKTARPD